MKPKATAHEAQRELFRTELEGLVDAGHALVKMERKMNWALFDEQLGQTYDPSNGAPGVSTRLMVALHYLKYRYDLSDPYSTSCVRCSSRHPGISFWR